MGFPDVLVVKNLPANAGVVKETGLIPESGRSPGEGHGKPLRYSCLENPMDRGAWRATVRRVVQSWTGLKWRSMHACTFPEYSRVWSMLYFSFGSNLHSLLRWSSCLDPYIPSIWPLTLHRCKGRLRHLAIIIDKKTQMRVNNHQRCLFPFPINQSMLSYWILQEGKQTPSCRCEEVKLNLPQDSLWLLAAVC